MTPTSRLKSSEAALNVDGREREHRDHDVRVIQREGSGKRGDDGKRRGDGAQPEPAHEPFAEGSLASCLRLALSETMSRAHSRTRSPSGVKPWNRWPRRTISRPSSSSSCLMPFGQRRLRHPARLGGAGEVLFMRQRGEIAKVAKQHEEKATRPKQGSTACAARDPGPVVMIGR